MVVSSNPLCLCEFQFTSQFIILVTLMLWTHFISILYNMGLGTIIKNLILNLLSHSGWKYEFCFCFKNMVKGCFCLEKVLQIIWKICILTLTQKTLSFIWPEETPRHIAAHPFEINACKIFIARKLQKQEKDR